MGLQPSGHRDPYAVLGEMIKNRFAVESERRIAIAKEQKKHVNSDIRNEGARTLQSVRLSDAHCLTDGSPFFMRTHLKAIPDLIGPTLMLLRESGSRCAGHHHFFTLNKGQPTIQANAKNKKTRKHSVGAGFNNFQRTGRDSPQSTSHLRL